MPGRKKRLIVNSAFSSLSWLAPLVLGVVVTPIVLGRLGTEAYGVYLVVLGFIGYSFSFNVGRTVAKYVAEYRASGEEEKINQAISSAFWLSLGVGVVGSLVIAGLARWVVTDVLLVSNQFQDAAAMSLVIGGFMIPAILLGQLYQSILHGVQSFGRASLLTNLNWITLNIGNILLVLNGYGIVELLAWNLIVVTAIALVSYAVVKRQEPSFRISLRIPREMFTAVAFYGSSVLLAQLFGNLLLLFERGWVMRHFGEAAAAYYLVPMSLAIYLHTFIASAAFAAFPMVNEFLNDRERLHDLYRRVTRIVVWIAAYLATSLICLGKSFLYLWVGNEFAERSYPVLIIHTVTFAAIAITVVAWQITESFHRARLNAIQVFVWASVAVILIIATSAGASIEGVGLARMAAVLITLPLLLYTEKRFLGEVFWSFWAALAAKVGLAAALLAVADLTIVRYAGTNWLVLVAAGAAGTIVFGSVLWLTGVITADEKELVSRFIRRPAPAE